MNRRKFITGLLATAPVIAIAAELPSNEVTKSPSVTKAVWPPYAEWERGRRVGLHEFRMTTSFMKSLVDDS